MANTRETHLAHGRVTGRHGCEVHGVRVTVWWQYIRRCRKLAAEEANEDGATGTASDG